MNKTSWTQARWWTQCIIRRKATEIAVGSEKLDVTGVVEVDDETILDLYGPLCQALNENRRNVLTLLSSTESRKWMQARIVNSGRYFLHVLARSANASRNKEILDACVSAGADINCQDFGGHTPLSIACLAKNVSMVKELLECGADTNKPNSFGETPLHMACFSSSSEIIELLFKKNADAMVTDVNGASLIHLCCNLGLATTMKSMIQYGADINQVDKWYRTPLMIAARHARHECVMDLLERGCNVDDTDCFGRNASRHILEISGYSSAHASNDILLELVQRGIDIYSVGHVSTLYHAVSSCFDRYTLCRMG
jgi:ankyrin repeat protein